jgi:putative membrane protein
MILPGISGAFILVLLGKYHHVLAAVSSGDVVTLAIVAAGAVAGLVTVARLLSWLFHRYHDATLAFLAGLMLGSLRKLWPWKKGLTWLRDDHGNVILDDHDQPIAMVEANFFPDLSAAGMVEEVVAAALLAVAGFALIIAVNRLALRAA